MENEITAAPDENESINYTRRFDLIVSGAIVSVVALVLGAGATSIHHDNQRRTQANAVLDKADEDFWAIEKAPEVSISEPQRTPIIRALTTLCDDLTIVHRGGFKSNKCDIGLPDYARTVDEVKPEDLVKYAKSAAQQKKENLRFFYGDSRDDWMYGNHGVPVNPEQLSELQSKKLQLGDLRKALQIATASNGQSYGGGMSHDRLTSSP